MSRYQELKSNPPVLNIKPDATEVIFNLISCMCDNKYKFRFKKGESGFFKLYTGMFCITNFFDGWDSKYYDLTWAADEGDWDKVIEIINSGYQKIETVRSR